MCLFFPLNLSPEGARLTLYVTAIVPPNSDRAKTSPLSEMFIGVGSNDKRHVYS